MQFGLNSYRAEGVAPFLEFDAMTFWANFFRRNEELAPVAIKLSFGYSSQTLIK
jgi:hypothetical protein